MSTPKTPTPVKPSTPKGMRDFLPEAMLRRQYVFDVVQRTFQRYGFEPLQTPVMENRETLFGKYGEDAEQLIFSARHQRSNDELALRYDLTVPLARVVAQYENELTFPFKRYHVAPVWRGERPQRGRYREFYQCDVDIVGVADATADAEVVAVAVAALEALGFPQFTVKINSRRLLAAMGAYSGVPEALLPELYRSVDKFDKIGADGVRAEFVQRGLPDDVVARMMALLTTQADGTAVLDALMGTLGQSDDGAAGLQELRDLAVALAEAQVPAGRVTFDFTMVRGLSYYTGPIFETVIDEPNLGSVMGGGRYDGLIGLFRRESLPTTGMSLGIERIIDVLGLLNLYPSSVGRSVVDVLVTVFNSDTRTYAGQVAAALRAGLNTELFLKDQDLRKQFTYADKKGVPLLAIAGPDEARDGVVTLRRQHDRHEVRVPLADALAAAHALLA